MADHYDDWRNLQTLCNALFGRNNLISSDFDDIKVWRVDWDFDQSQMGRRIQFVVSDNATGKIMTDELLEALQALDRKDEDDATD